MRRLISLLLAFFCLSGLCLRAGAASGIIYSHPTGAEKPRVALTFDDGPHPRYTPQILEILEEYGVVATFFSVGINAETYPELIKRELAAGHEIGNHTYNHYHVSKLSQEALEKDIHACTQALERISGRKITLFRPPEGICSDSVKAICGADGMCIVLWSIDTRDWAHPAVCDIYQNVKQNVKDGAIILMHDFIGKNSPTPAALRQIIPMLLALGYEFVTVTQLLEGTE